MMGTEVGGRYGVIERLGMGGMGAVYKGVDLKRNLTVAIKVLREVYAKHPAIRERFVREAEAGASLSHPNVVPLVDFGVEESGRLWLAMEYVQGWTLRDEINHNGAFSVRSAIELTRQMLKGLAAAHDAGLIHRDLKHDNIMYRGRRDSFKARIVDFGVVKSEAADLMRGAPFSSSRASTQRASSAPSHPSNAHNHTSNPASTSTSTGRPRGGVFDMSAELGAEGFDLEAALAEAQAYADGAPAATRLKPEPAPEPSPLPHPSKPQKPTQAPHQGEEPLSKALTAAGMMVGSPSYMAPEQIRGLKVGPPADLYALAVVVYEVLVARRLFSVNDYETLLKEGAQRDAPRLVFTAKGEVIPDAFADLIARALAHDPTDRYPDAHTMLLALEQLNLKGSHLPPHLLSRLPSLSLDERGRPRRLDDTLSASVKRTPSEIISSTHPQGEQPQGEQPQGETSPHEPHKQTDLSTEPALNMAQVPLPTAPHAQTPQEVADLSAPLGVWVWALPALIFTLTLLTVLAFK